jgi:RNase P/RNase MRP subunit POP5
MKQYLHQGSLTWRYNLYDEHDKFLEFEIIADNPLTYDKLKLRVLEDYQRVLGMAQVVGAISYTYKLYEVLNENNIQ